jgi:hypothetical protein
LIDADQLGAVSIIPILPITRRQFASRIAGRDLGPQFLQFGFEKGVGDDQRLDRLARITVAGRNSLTFFGWQSGGSLRKQGVA